MEQRRSMVPDRPAPVVNGPVRRCCADLRNAITARWPVTRPVRAVGGLPRRLDVIRLQPRPFHPDRDAPAPADIKKNSRALWRTPCGRQWQASQWHFGFRRSPVGQQGHRDFLWAPAASRRWLSNRAVVTADGVYEVMRDGEKPEAFICQAAIGVRHASRRSRGWVRRTTPWR